MIWRTTLAALTIAVAGAASAETQDWTVTEMNGQPIVSEHAPTILFDKTGKVSGKAGCNRFFGTVEIKGKKMTFGEGMGATKMACPPPLDQIETDFFAALPKVSGFVKGGGALVLTDDIGTELLVLRQP